MAKEGRISAPRALTATAPRGDVPLAGRSEAPVAPAAPVPIGPQAPGSQTQTTSRMGSKMSRNNEQEKQHDLAVAQVTALRERLFREQTLEPRKFGRGDVHIELPARRQDGQPVEFVLTLAFGGESLDVHYRERVSNANP